MQAKKAKVGDTISVYWPEDRVWYEGEVLSIDEVSDRCEVLYEDGEREVLTLTKEKYKINKDSKKGRLFDVVLENDGDVSKQLGAIASILYDMEDRLPSKGVCSSRLGWWSSWHIGVESAVKAGSVILLAKSTRELACQLRPSVTTSWWNGKGAEWREHLRTVKGCAELLSFVTDLLTKGVDWSRARQLFPTSNGHDDGGGSHSVGGRESHKDPRTQASKKARVARSSEKYQVRALKSFSVKRVVDMKTHKEVSSSRPKRVKKQNEEEMGNTINITSPPQMEGFVENGPSSKERVSSKAQQNQDGREGRRNEVASAMDEVHKEDNGSRKKSSPSTRSRRNVEQEDWILKEEVQLNHVRSPKGGGRAGKTAVGGQVRGGETNRPRRSAKQEQYDDEDSSSKEEDADDESSYQVPMDKERGGQKGRKRGARAGKGALSDDDSGAPSSRLRGTVKSTSHSVQHKSAKRLRGNVKQDLSDREEESLEEGGEEGSSDDSDGGRSDGSGDEEYGQDNRRVGQFASTRSSKRKSDEIDHGLGKKKRREGMQTRCEAMSRSGASGVGGRKRSSLKEESDSDDDFVMEGSEESPSSEDVEGTSGALSDGVSDDSASEEDVKQKAPSKAKGPGVPRIKSLDPALSDEEVCSVCEFAGAADMMLLCDGENCEEAFHSFCLKLPLQSIPEGDWLCPLCLDKKCITAETSKPVKKTSKMRAKLIPPPKKVEAIIGWREDPSTIGTKKAQDRKLQYLVKWCSLSHRHDTWVPEEWLVFADRGRLYNYQRKSFGGDGDELSDERRPEWVQIDRIIACRKQESHVETLPPVQGTGEAQDSRCSKMEYLVKWTNIEYSGSTWEEEVNDQDMQEAIQIFLRRHSLANEKACIRPTERVVAPTIKQQPTYITGGVLHGYQLQGLKWLLSNFQQRKSVILADEMGLGKTIQAASLIMALKHENLSIKPVLVIGPKSTLVGWEQELRQWGADLNSVIYQGEKDSRSMIQNYEFYTKEKNPLFDVLVTSYNLAMLDNSPLQKFHWSCIIVDEGHRVKNMRSKLGILLKRQTTDFRLLLTGTPVQNTLTELFALLHFLDPKEFPDPEKSALDFAQVDALGGAGCKDEGGMEQQVSRIHELLRPRMLRRLKGEVMQGMIPGKKYLEVMCALTPLQRHLYAAILKKNYKQLNRGNTTGKKRSLNFILMDLKMVCNHPYLFPGKEPDHADADEAFKFLVGASGKLQLLDKLLPKLKEGGHRVLLFSQMTSMLDILEDFLSHLDYKFCRIDGSTHASERQKQIAEFNDLNSDIFIFLISTRAGGLGINLPSADTVIIYDPDFNPFVDLQAQARAHRIGQEKVVLVYQLITKCSVEEKILQRSQQKLAMENLVMSSSEKETAQDVNTLLLHGARKVLEEHDVEATSVKWTDENLEKLLNRDISDTKDVKEDGAGYLGAIQETGDVLGGLPPAVSPNVKTGREWEELLGKLAEQDMETEEGKLGRGKRHRKKIQYTFEPNIETHEEEEEAPDAVEDDPSCSGGSGSGSGSESDVSLDEEKGKGTRGPYLTKAKSMKLEQESNALVPLKQSPVLDVPVQGPHQMSNANPLLYTPTVSQLPPHLQNLPENSQLILIPLYPMQVSANQPSPTQPTNPTPSASWHSSPFLTASLTAVSGSSSSPGLSVPQLTASNPPLWNDLSHSPRLPPGSKHAASKQFREMMSPRNPGPVDTSLSMAQTHRQMQAPASGPAEASKLPPTQRFSPSSSSGPSQYPSVGHKAPDGATLVYNSVDVKVKQASSSMHQTSITSFGSTATSTGVDNLRVSPSMDMSTGLAKGSFHGSKAAHMPMSHSLSYVTNGTAPEAIPPQASLPAWQGAFGQQTKQSYSTDFLSLEETLRRTGSLLTGTNQLSSSGALSQFMADAKDISLEEALWRTGSMLAGSKQGLSSGALSQDARDMSLEEVLRRTGSMLTGSKQGLYTGSLSQLLQDAEDISLEEVLRRTGSKLTASKQVLSPGVPSQLLQNVKAIPSKGSMPAGIKQVASPGAQSQHSQDAKDMSLDEAARRKESTLTGSKQILYTGASSPVLQEVKTTGSKQASPNTPKTRLPLVSVKTETGVGSVDVEPIGPTGPPASSSS